MRRIGFIGLGMMGRPMAHRLHAAGHALVVHDIDPAAVASFVADHPGAVAATPAPTGQAEPAGTTPSPTFADCPVLVTMLPNSDIVDAVLGEVAPRLPAGACVIDMSSSDPSRTRAMATRLAAQGIGMIDAPVSGGVRRAVAGTLAIMVGGDPALFDAHRPLLATMGQTLTWVGPAGAGHALKALNNYVSAAGMIAAIEAVHAGAAFGIDRATLVEVLNASTGRNNTTENKIRQFMLSGTFDSGFSLALQAKDVGIAAALGPALDVPMPLASRVSELTDAASRALGPGADHTELYRVGGPR